MQRTPATDYLRDYLTRGALLAFEHETDVYCSRIALVLLVSGGVLDGDFDHTVPGTITMTGHDEQDGRVVYVHPLTALARRRYGGLLLDYDMLGG